MISALRARRLLARRAALPAAVATTMLLTAGSASVAAPATGQGSASGHSLQTLLSGVKVFASATTRAATTGQLGSGGTTVSVDCWTTGIDYNADPIWYQISAPVTGYVAAFDIAAHFAPAAHIPHCLSPAFSEIFNSLEANLRIRTGPTTSAPIAGYLTSIGSKVIIDCYVTGGLIFSDPIWYHAVSPAVGYVTGRLLNTGNDPAPGVPRC